MFSKCSCLITRYTKSFSLLFPKSRRYLSFIHGSVEVSATSVSISRPAMEIFHRRLTFEPPRIEALLVGLNFFFFFSFFFFIAPRLIPYLSEKQQSIDGYIYIFQRFQFFSSSTFVRSAESIFPQTFSGMSTLPDRENLRATLSLSGCNITRHSLMISRVKHFRCDHLLNV